MAWVHEKLIGNRARDLCAEAMKVTEDVTIKVRSLREQIQPYVAADDPFAAMTRAHERASSYREAQNREP
jgi:hypothetical protein